jgi:hypothetical protein
MIAWRKMMVAAVAPLMLSGCLWGPGKFNSELALHKNGSFVLDYRGEIVLQMPEDKASVSVPWSNDKARCFESGVITVDGITVRAPVTTPMGKEDEVKDRVRPCTAAELAESKTEYEQKAEKKRQENEQMAELFGLPGSDDASNRRFAENLMKYKGWRSATYKGKGVFDVDYHFEGRIGQDYAFPVMPNSDLIIPFITIRQRNDGSVMVTAPALTGGSGPFSARAKMMGLPDKGSDGPVSRAEGRFTIVTDGEILTNNSEDGPVATPAGRQVHWDVGPGSDKIPEMLVRL